MVVVTMEEARPQRCRPFRRVPLTASSLSMRTEVRSISHKATCNTKPRPKLGASAILGILSEAHMALQAITLMVSLGLVPLRKAITVMPQPPTHPHTYAWEHYIVGDNSNNGLVGQYANADWGVYNAISNGGNKAGLWRTLTSDEWEYVINGREGSRFCKATLNGVKGLILIPDGWDNVSFALNRINSTGAAFDANTISQSTWENTCAPAGLVFLPQTGKRVCNGMGDHYVVTLDLSEGYGLYWSSTAKTETSAYQYNFHSGNVNLDGGLRYQGLAVRLVQDVQ